MLAQPNPRGLAPPNPRQHTPSLQVFSLILALFSLCACEPYDEPNCSPHANDLPDHGCSEPLPDDRDHDTGVTPIAYRHDCLDQDGPLCLTALTWRDSEVRRGAISPGERVMIESITLANDSATPVDLTALTVRAETGALSLVDGNATLLELLGEPGDERPSSRRCGDGVLPPLSACRFRLMIELQIEEDAPVDQQQGVRLSLSYQSDRQQAQWQLSFPLLVVDSTFGLERDEVTIEDSSLDGRLQAGDRLRFSEIPLRNYSLAPFEELEVQVSSSSPWVSYAERGEMWSDHEGVTSGPISAAQVRCPGATLERSSEGDIRAPGRCALSIPSTLLISPEAPPGELVEFELRFKSLGDQLQERFTISYELQPLESSLRFEELTLESDENDDGLLSPGERVVFNKLALFNEGPSALSLQGRLSVLSEGATLLSGSDMSVDFSAQELDFYERCLPGERCLTSVRVRLDLSPELVEGDEVLIQLELLDQSGQRYELQWAFPITSPHVELELTELRVTQDTLNERLSAGERGLISYLQLINRGDADAVSLTGELWTDSPYILSESGGRGRVSWPLELREMSEAVSLSEEGVSRCISTQRDEDAYCYQRLELAFEVSPEAPIGERVTFWIDLTDDLGQAYQLSYELQLF